MLAQLEKLFVQLHKSVTTKGGIYMNQFWTLMIIPQQYKIFVTGFAKRGLTHTIMYKCLEIQF